MDKFVRSPIHNQHEEVIRLFQYLRRNLNSHERGLEKEKVYSQLYPNEPFNMQQLHYVSSYLLKVVEEFLAWHEWKYNSDEHQLALLRSLRSHRLESLFDRQIEKSEQEVKNSAIQDTKGLFLAYEIALERFNHDRLKGGKIQFRLQETSDALDTFIIAEKLRNACILLSNQTVSQSSYNTGLLPKVLEFIEERKQFENPVIAIYYHAYRTLEDYKNDESYRAFKDLLQRNSKSFNINELHDIFIFAINYCIRQLNSGEQGFMKEVFDIYKIGLQMDVFVQNGVMTPRTYSNIVMSGLKLNEYDWVQAFIEKYRDTLPEKQKDGFFNYNLARLYYEQKNFSAAMPLLLQMDYDDFLLTSLGKVLLAKMQYEQGEFESLSSLLQSFKTYVMRKKLSGNYQEGTLNFIHFLSKLIHKTSSATETLHKELSETKIVVEKEWLLAQL